jgi:hypothetical protein
MQIQFRISIFFLLDLISKPDCIIIQRAISPKIIAPWNKFLLRIVYGRTENLIWDFDDNLEESKEITKYERGLLEQYSSSICVTGEVLRGTLPERLRERTHIIPTTDKRFLGTKTSYLLSKRRKAYMDRIDLVWLATSSNMPYLYGIAESLDKTGKILSERLNKKLILHVVCNKEFTYESKFFKVDNISWSHRAAYNVMSFSHIGLMPLEDTEFCRGKGGFKLIQYMSASIPCVASAVGINSEIISEGKSGYLIGRDHEYSWENAIMLLSSSWDSYCTMAENARERWEDEYSYDNNLSQWNLILSSV